MPSLVSKKEETLHGDHASSDMHFHLVSRVFVLRCRACERESVYSMDQIVDYALPVPAAAKEASAASA